MPHGWNSSFQQIVQLVNDVEMCIKSGWHTELLEIDPSMGPSTHYVATISTRGIYIHKAWYEKEDLVTCLVHCALLGKIREYYSNNPKDEEYDLSKIKD